MSEAPEDAEGAVPAPAHREIVGVAILDGARFACQGSGMCCGGYAFGPIEDAVVQAVARHRFSENESQIHGAQGPFDTVEVDGQPMRVLRLVGARCVFLNAENLCLIHKELGAESKPALCRAYPFNVALAPDGVAYVSLNMECGGFAEGCKGTLVEDELEALLDPLLELPNLALGTRVALDAHRVVDFDAALALEHEWLADLDADRPPAAWVGDLAARLFNVAPGPTRPWRSWARARPLVERLKDWCGEVAGAERAEGNLIDAELNTRARLACALWLGDEGAPSSGALPGERLDDAATHLMRTQLRNVVFGKAMHRAPHLAAGLAFEALKLGLAAALVPTLAAQAGKAAPDEAVVNEALRTLNRCLRQSSLRTLSGDALGEWLGLAHELAGIG
jgi:Fe-S-cluster containining protein